MLHNYNVFYDEKHKCFQLRTKGEIYTITFNDDYKKHLFERIIKDTFNKKSPNYQKILNKYLKKYEKQAVNDVFNQLKETGLINLNGDKIGFENSFNSEKSSFQKTGIIGNSLISEILKDKFKATHKKYSDLSSQKSIEKFLKEIDFFIVDAEDWNPDFMLNINTLATSNNIPWMYIGGIIGNKAHIGPIFHGKSTGCYNCLQQRLKSNMDFPSYFETYEEYLSKEGKMAKKETSIDSTFYELIAQIAFLEARKHVYFIGLSELYGALFVIDLNNLHIERHPLLKAPLCEICKPELKHNIAPWLEPIVLKHES